MASPQTENGFTRLADELLEALVRFPFTKRQYKVLLAVIRKTYGFHKREDDITAPQLAVMTGLDRANVIRAINELVAIQVLNKRAGRYGQVLGVNKDYETWVVPNQHRGRPGASGVETAPHAVPNQHLSRCQHDTTASAEATPSTKKDQQTPPNTPPPQAVRTGPRVMAPPTPTGGGEDLIFPREMTGCERREAQALVTRAGNDAQAVLDVLTAAIQAGEVRKSRLAVLAGLMRRHQAGTFDPAPGLHLAEQRRRAAAMEAAQRRQQQAFVEQLRAQAPIGDGDGRQAFQRILNKLNRSKR